MFENYLNKKVKVQTNWNLPYFGILIDEDVAFIKIKFTNKEGEKIISKKDIKNIEEEK